MNRKHSSLIIALLGLSLCGEHVRAQTAISPLAQSLVTPSTDMTAEESQLLFENLLLAGSTAEADLITAFNSGPPVGDLSSIASGTATDYAAIQAWLTTSGTSKGFDADTISSIVSQTPKQLAQAEANSYTFRYQSNALTFLAPIAGPTGKALLASIAADPRSPFQPIAKAAIVSNFRNLWAAYEAPTSNNFGLQAVAPLSPGVAVNPVSTDTIVRVGSFVTVIPAGSFVPKGRDSYVFSGSVNLPGGGAANFTVEIVVVNPVPAYAKQIGQVLLIGVKGSGVNMSSFPSSVEVGFMLGGVGGTGTALRL